MIDIYIMETCPYCKKVLDFADKIKIKYNKKDIEDMDNHNNLIKMGGKDQVPFLADGEIYMYESDDIISYLSRKKEEQ